MNEAIQMQISAFVDGELPAAQVELLLRRLCRDAQLRQQVADYLALGRIVRGEYSLSGMGGLRQRISSSLEEEAAAASPDAAEALPARRRRMPYARSLAGMGIAAAVAMIALVGLRQFSPSGQFSPSADAQTVPGLSAEHMEYARLHQETSNTLYARRTGFEWWAQEQLAAADNAAGAADEPPP